MKNPTLKYPELEQERTADTKRHNVSRLEQERMAKKPMKKAITRLHTTGKVPR